MSTSRPQSTPVAIVGVGAILPDAPDAPTFWSNLCKGRYSISDVTDRWDADLYYDPDPSAPDMTYSKIGGWCRDYEWNPLGWRMPIPPKVGEVMDPAQKWAVACTREALSDYGYPERPLDRDRTAVIVGNALGGDFHLRSAARILFPEMGEELKKADSFQALPADVRKAVFEELVAGVRTRIPDITEDTMPGELGNIVAGRVAALFDFKGPNYIADAACASALAAMSAAVEGLRQRDYDAVITGGIDANMSASTFVKFAKIGALSASGTRPYAEGADGFVMGEGAAVFLMKRLEDAERDGDRIYSVLLGVGGSSDGKGKGITAPNPVGQKLAVARGWERAGVAPEAGDMVEGHGTSTRVGDVVEVESLSEVFQGYGLPVGSLALGSVKSNIGHLKAAAGSAGVLKATLALHHKELPPSVNFAAPNPNIDFSTSPFAVNTAHRPWEKSGGNGDTVRRAGISAFGFGGTNFHMVMEEHVPGRHRAPKVQVQGAELHGSATGGSAQATPAAAKIPLRGALVIGGADEAAIASRLRQVKARADAGEAPPPAPPREADLRAPVRLAIDYGDAEELAGLAEKALKALDEGLDGRWRALRNKGVYLGRGAPGKVAFLFPGQGSQYVDMLKELRDAEPVVAETFREADRVMTPVLDGPLTARIFVETDDDAERQAAEEALKQTEVTQPAVLTVDTALSRLFTAYGVAPDMVMGHSLGEYAALVAAGGMPFGSALLAVAARGQAMRNVSTNDDGLMAAVFAPVDEVQKVLDTVDGYAVVANINSTKECVIGGATEAMRQAVDALTAAGIRNTLLPVSHAFHTRIVEGAAQPLMKVLRDSGLQPPHTPVVANIDAEFYPVGPEAPQRMVEILGQQIGSAVQFVQGLEKLYDAGARVFVEMGPKRALYGMADDVVGSRDGVTVLFTNHPRTGDVVSVNRALCGLYAEGLGRGVPDAVTAAPETTDSAAAAEPTMAAQALPAASLVAAAPPTAHVSPTGSVAPPASTPGEDRYVQLGRMFADFLDKSFETYAGGSRREQDPVRVGITGASLGLPGEGRVFSDEKLAGILRGQGFIASMPESLTAGQLDRRITRLVKGSQGEARFETIDDPADVIKLAGRGGEVDLADEFGFPQDRIIALDRVTRLAIAAGIDALRDAGIPLVMRYKSTTTGSKLPAGWGLPEEMRDDTGVVFGSAFPGYDFLVKIIEEYHEDRARRAALKELESLRGSVSGPAADALEQRVAELSAEIGEKPYEFDRRFLFQVLSMGHSQFAEYIGARGPNTALNGACATGMQAMAQARDWIETGRCRRVIVITADDITTDAMFPWWASGFLASGAAATDARVEDAAVPFDKRRHGLIIGMGGAGLVLEDMAVAAERGLWPICEVLGTVVANSAFHGSRLDMDHITDVMESLVGQVERRWGVSRYELAPQMVFVSHETYTPARGGSAGAEVRALRKVFGAHADRIVVANTKGFTGHPMGVGIEESLSVKMLETGIIPPVANYREVDPELGQLNLSRGGDYPVQYALRLGAGFGSQIAMSILRWTPPPDGARRKPEDLGFQHRIGDPAAWSAWLARVTGYPAPELEVVQRTLRVKDQGPPAVQPAPRAATAMGVAPPAAGVAGVAAQAPAPVPPSAPPAPPVRDVPVPVAPAPVVAPAAAEAAASAPTPVAPAPTDPAPVKPAAEPADPVAQRVLEIVAEQTGYPPDMLALDLDLEADLGIDTVKQAEMFAAIRAEYDIERDDNLALRDYPTLGRAIEFVFEKRPDLKSAAPAGAPAPATPAPAPATPAPAAVSAWSGLGSVATRVLELVSEQTGYPPDMLELDLDLEADLGIDTVKQAEMFAAIRGEYDIERDDNLALRDYPTLARAIEFVFEKRPDLEEEGRAPVMAGTAPAAGVAAAQPTAQPVVSPAAPAVSTTPQPGAAPASATDPVALKVLEIVSEQTGYPQDMLELDLDLEADLGIDTVKQAEMFAAIRGEYDIERDDNLALRDYPTLARAIDFVYEKRPDLERPDDGVGGESGVAPGAGAGAAAAPVSLAEAQEASGRSAGPGDSAVANKVLEIVSEQTGYPQDMLELDLDLEADLGIDTVKQAEMFAAIRGAYDIERDETLALRDYPTLARAIEFVYEKRPDLRPGAGGSGAPTGAAEAEPSSSTGEPGPGAATAEGPQAVRGSMEAAQGIPRRVPVPRLRPSLDRFPTTGVEIGDGSRVIVVPDQGGVGAALGELLKKQGAEVLLADATQSTETLVAEVETFAAAGTLTGLYWLPALDGVTDEETAGTEERREAIRRRVKNLHAVMRALYDRMGDAGTFLLSGVRLGGYHGYDEAGATDVLGGAVVGYTKAFGRERPDALVKALDFAPSRKTTALARVFLDETLRDPGAVEIGYGGDARWSVGLEERPVEPGESLGTDTVYVITGAAGSIVSAILTDLAEASGGAYWLLDLAPEPDPADPDLARLVSDPDGLKRDLFQRMQAEGERVTPVQVEREMARLEREASAVAAIQAIEAAGGSVHYRSLDLRDTDAVASVMAEVVKAHGRVDVMVHAAGLEISRTIPKKSQDEFDLVFDVKTEGWYNLLAGLGEAPLGAAVVFSSIAGRFGNAGQVDYAAANDLLCKAVSHLRRTRPESRGVSLDWTAWRDIGMAARGSIPSIMKAAGIDMLPPDAGIPIVRRELTAGTRGEVVVAQALGIMLQEDAERTALAEGVPDDGEAGRGPMTGAVKGFRLQDGLVVETTLSPGEQPFLEDHRIDGTAVLPGVMGLEAMAEAARVPFPERYVSAIEDVAFHAPFKFYRDEPRTVTVTVTYGQDGDDLVADCRLLGARQLVGREEPEVTVHFTGRVRLTPEAPSAGVRADLPESASEVVDAPDIYATYFHGPAYQVLKNAWRADSMVVGRFADDMPPNHSPKEQPTLTAPRLVELAFQTAGLAEIAESQRMGLPHAFDRMEILQPMNGVEAETTALVSTSGEGVFDIQVADADGQVVLVLKGYRTSALPTTVDAGAFHALKA